MILIVENGIVVLEQQHLWEKYLNHEIESTKKITQYLLDDMPELKHYYNQKTEEDWREFVKEEIFSAADRLGCGKVYWNE
jgi:hypothetical protein